MKKNLLTCVAVTFLVVCLGYIGLQAKLAKAADIPTPPPEVKFDIEEWFLLMMPKVVTYVSVFVGAMVIVFLLLAAYNFLTSGGDPTKVAKARQMVIFALVGVAVFVLAYSAVSIVKTILRL